MSALTEPLRKIANGKNMFELNAASEELIDILKNGVRTTYVCRCNNAAAYIAQAHTYPHQWEELGKLIPLNVRRADEARARKLMERTTTSIRCAGKKRMRNGLSVRCRQMPKRERSERIDAKIKCKHENK